MTLCLEGARCLVVGGGEVAVRKAVGLLRESADVTVVAPRCDEALAELAQAGRLVWERRSYRPGEAAGFRLVFAATDSREVNRRVCDDANAGGVWVNVADDPELCTFHLPARVERGPLQVAISSNGGAPFVVRRLRELLERWLAPEWSEWAIAATRFRDRVRSSGATGERREALYDRYFGETVDRLRLRVRVPSEGESASWLAAPAAETPAAGFVSLVGAGPGAAGLLTLRGYRRLLAADAIVYDRLAEPALPCDLPAATELISVGKEAGRHLVPQEEINALLVSLAHQGKRVVRFKGGDPFVFGRGGEEALALRRAGVAFEIVPGVTTGVAGPAFAGVPVTQRGVATSVTLFTAHLAADEEPDAGAGSPLDAARSTLVGFMGLANLAAVTSELERRGVGSETPAVLIERATTSRQRCVPATVGGLARAAREACVRPPALLVVGETVRLASDLGWFERQPLARHRLVMLSPGGGLSERLELAGAEVLELPAPATSAALVALRALPLTGWVARTAEEAVALCAMLAGEEVAAGAVGWCLGEAAVRAARRAAWPVVRELARACDGERVVHSIAGG